MKVFEAPEVEIVNFGKSDIVTQSSCKCVDCTICPSGKNDCAYVETCPEYCARFGN